MLPESLYEFPFQCLSIFLRQACILRVLRFLQIPRFCSSSKPACCFRIHRVPLHLRRKHQKQISVPAEHFFSIDLPPHGRIYYHITEAHFLVVLSRCSDCKKSCKAIFFKCCKGKLFCIGFSS